MSFAKQRFSLSPGILLRLFTDGLLIQFSLIAAICLRFLVLISFQTTDEPMQSIVTRYVTEYCRSAGTLTAICLLVFCMNGFYTYGKYYTSRYKVFVVIQAVSLSFLLFGFASYFLSAGQLTTSRGALGFAWILTSTIFIASRIWSDAWRKYAISHSDANAKNRSEKTVLVIGGAGYIGSALVPLLLQEGYHVRLLDLMLFGEGPLAGVLEHPDLEIIEGDFRHVEVVVGAMKGVSSVVHLGAIVGDPACSLDPELTIDINLTATRMIAELARSAGIRRFIFASTCSVYGACDQILDERSVVNPISLYGRTKLCSEDVLKQMASDTFQPTIVRFATIYGFSGRTRFDLVVNLLSAKAKIDGAITVFGGDQWRPFVHVQDAARAVAMMVSAPLPLIANETYNVGSNDQNYTITQIGELVHEYVPSAELTVDDDGDKRNYRVCFDKINLQLDFTPAWTVELGIQQVLEAIAAGEVEDYTSSQYSNVRFLTEANPKSLVRDDWARELINGLTGPDE